MTTINLQETHNCRVEWVQSSIMGFFDLPHRPEKYNTPEKWESTISSLMSTSARDFDAKKLHPDSTKHATEALNPSRKATSSTTSPPHSTKYHTSPSPEKWQTSS